jgi:hypothetical protein
MHAENYALISPMDREIARLNFDGKLKTAVEEEGAAQSSLDFGKWQSTVEFGFPQFDGGDKAPATKDHHGRALVAQLSPDEFLVAGIDARIKFQLASKENGREQILRAELERGVPFGGQVGDGELCLLPCGLVAAIVRHDGIAFVKTVLTRDQAIANMESQGAILRPACSALQQRQDVRRPPATGDVARMNAELRVLAEQHFNDGTSRKRRNAILREHGYDPAGSAGEIYRTAYLALIEAHWARKREEYWRTHPLPSSSA